MDLRASSSKNISQSPSLVTKLFLNSESDEVIVDNENGDAFSRVNSFSASDDAPEITIKVSLT